MKEMVKKKMVLVEDRPWRTTVALKTLVEKKNIKIEKVLYFSQNEENINKLDEFEKSLSLEVQKITYNNFNSVLNEYYDRSDVFILIDYDLEKENLFPEERVNVKFAMNKINKGIGKIWFYTSAGSQAKTILNNLFGDQVVDVDTQAYNELAWIDGEIEKIAEGNEID